MAHAHNLFLRGLNSVYLQAPMVKQKQDVEDLFIFCRAWIIGVKHHHGIEETKLFPAIEEITRYQSTCEKERAQHKIIHDGLNLLERYLTETAPEKYRWEDLQSVFNTFVPTLHAHLNEEIQILLSLENIQDKEGLIEIWKQTEDAAKAFKHPRTFVSCPGFSSVLMAIQLAQSFSVCC